MVSNKYNSVFLILVSITVIIINIYHPTQYYTHSLVSRQRRFPPSKGFRK